MSREKDLNWQDKVMSRAREVLDEMESLEKSNNKVSGRVGCYSPSSIILKQIVESGLSRLKLSNIKHDSGVITAFRKLKVDKSGRRSGYTKRENLQRNRQLLAHLNLHRYSITSVKGSYIENYKSEDAYEVGERSFFVVDQNDRGNLEKVLRELGENYDQDSIMFIPKGATEAYLIGTSKRKNSYPGYNEIVEYTKSKYGHTGEFFSRIKGRPFTYEGSSNESLTQSYERFDIYDHLDLGISGLRGEDLLTKMDWRKIDLPYFNEL